MRIDARVSWVLAALMGAVQASAGAQEAVDIGSRLEPIVDRYLIERFEGAELRLHEPRPGETVLRFDAPWEGRYCGYVTVFKDGDKYRMYYRGLPSAGKDGSDVECTCYAESADGMTWTKPNLGLFEVDGVKDNNAVLHGMAPYSHNFAPFLDTKPDVPAEQRYKAVAGTSETGLGAFGSPDGLHWTKLQEAPILAKGAFDSQNVAFWSEAENCYVCYYRTWTEGEFGGYRTISRATSPDFLQWSEGVPMKFGNTPPEHLYTNQTVPYFRAPHLYIALAARFMPKRRVISAEQAVAIGGEAGYSGDCSDTVFMTSRGGDVYDRTFMEGFVRPGLGLGNWTSRTNYTGRGIVPTGDEEISFYVQRHYGQTSHHLQRMILRPDGFASLHGSYDGGEAFTKPLRFAGKELVVNYATSAAGSVWIELQDADGQALPGFSRVDADELVGDELERVVTWQGLADLSALAGKPVRLRVILKDADVYALRFR